MLGEEEVCVCDGGEWGGGRMRLEQAIWKTDEDCAFVSHPRRAALNKEGAWAKMVVDD